MWEQFVNMVDGFKLITLVVLIGVDFLMGVILALKSGTFDIKKIADFLNTSVLGMVGGYYLVGLAAVVHPDVMQPIVIASWVAIDAALIGMIVDKAQKLKLPVTQ